MNGVISRELAAADRHPIITCAGELEVFSGLEENLSVAIPQEPCEWRRSLGRPVRSVHIGVRFLPFSREALPRENQWDLIRQPLFHIYWTDCADVEAYKGSVREDLDVWIRDLTACNINDWLIVVVESYDARRTNKLLPRTTVLDKIRADFAPKQGDRCISVLSPRRQETRTADSWRGLVARVRHLVLVAYARAVSRLEEHVRQQRERRTQPGWHFVTYFRLQEELAQVLEMLGLHDEALVQYDELDALFSQFVVNAHITQPTPDSADCWLTQFQTPLVHWRGLRLAPPEPEGLPEEPSLLELRAYLFARQAHMLLATGRPWEVASRCLPFLHGCVRELALLEVSAPPGALACWLFLACLEILQTCERFNHTGQQVDAYSLYTAGLWAYAAEKLRELGRLCGLLPGAHISSERLHIVVQLSAGMGDCPGPSPTDKLREALRSKDAFNRHYLELCELAMGTYKHIGRHRSARLVGRELASFYKLLGQTQKAAAFLGDALRTLEQEGWRELAVQTHLELAECHRLAGDARSLVRSCSAVAAAPEMDTVVRCAHLDEMLSTLDTLDRGLIVAFGGAFKVISVHAPSTSFVVQDAEMLVTLELECDFPREVVCSDLQLSLEEDGTAEKEKIPLRRLSSRDLKCTDLCLQRLSIQRRLDYRQDKQISSASVECKSASLRRVDSVGKTTKGDFTKCLKPTELPLRITPGLNVIRLRWLAETGKYNLAQISLSLGHLEFLSARLTPRLTVEVRREEPSVRLDKSGPTDLLAGLEQELLLTVTIGSYALRKESVIKLRCSKGLSMHYEPGAELISELEVPLTDNVPFACTRLTLRTFAELSAKEHKVTVQCPWTDDLLTVPLDFIAPLVGSWRLHAANQRKFIQVIVSGRSAQSLQLENVRIYAEGATFKDYNPVEHNQRVVVSSGLNVSYLWEVFPCAANKIKTDFSIEYTIDKENSVPRTFHYTFEVANYETLYLIEAKIDPTKGNEFCRAGALCHLRLCIKRLREAPGDSAEPAVTSLMYEVLAEQNVWAVCGRTAGVVSLETMTGGDGEAAQVVTLDVMPLASGFLPMPLIRLSKYIPAEKPVTDGSRKAEPVNTHPRLDPFSHGQVYNVSRARQVHVLAAVGGTHL